MSTGGTDRDPKLYVEWTEGGNTQMTASSSFAFAGDAVSPSWSTTNWHGVTVYRDVS